MTGKEFKAELKALGINKAILARCLGVHAETTVYRWTGTHPIPQAVIAYLRVLALLPKGRLREELARGRVQRKSCKDCPPE